MNTRVEKVSPENLDDFFQLHSGQCGWCYCTAWWTKTWEGWTERTDEQNKGLRQELFAKGEYDGYLLYLDDGPVGWCQVGKRDRLIELIAQYKLKPNPDIWAITCFVIRPEHRRKGLAKILLNAIIDELKQSGVKEIQSFPKRTDSTESGQHWRGPLKLYLNLGFKIKRENESEIVLMIDLTS